ncbi:hypothetical protein [Vibrio sp. 99-8-1]|uniref:hypothetical protein n=1 Tax=Vibrio sp. 99-8-1 TaxID=2607602 RepID=UPI001493C36C|nr:hypothetical protein [Vibrio sp. 99-8-1]NOI66931.1 hypothetical protein [Vibrio sp. 99-8-1]
MSYGPIGGASSYGMSRESFDNSIGKKRHESRSESDRNRRESNYVSRQETKRRREAEKRAREAKEKAERKERAKARKLAQEEDDAKKALDKQSAENETTLASGGVLDKMKHRDFSNYGSIHFRPPTKEEAKLGYTPNDAFSARPSYQKGEQDIANYAKEAIDEKHTDIAADAVGSMISAASGVPFGGAVAKKGVEVVREWTSDDTDWEKQLKSNMKSKMEGDGLISTGKTVAGAGAAYSAARGSAGAASISNALNTPTVGIGLGMVDDVVGLESYKNQNRDYLASKGVDITSVPREPSSGDSGRRSSGILPAMKMPNLNPSQIPSKPQFAWISDIDTSWSL